MRRCEIALALMVRVMKEQVPVEKLAKGMFVADLDRPWVGTPFLMQGFVVETDREIEQLRNCCKYVMVDRSLSTGKEFIPDLVEKLAVSQRIRTEPKARIYQDNDKDSSADVRAGEAGDGLLGSLGKIFKSAFSAENAPPPEQRPAQPTRPREPVVTIYKDKPVRLTPQEATALREKGISNEERRFLEPDADPDINIQDGTSTPTKSGGGMFGRITRLFRTSAEEQKQGAASQPVEEAPVYVDQTTIENELPMAQEAHEKVERVLRSVIDDLNKNKTIELDKVNEAVGWVVESVVRNPDGMMWLTRLKSVDAYTYDHGLNTAIYLIAFGRYLGLPEDQLQTIGTVGLMQDVGKIKLPRALLEKSAKLTLAELKVFQSHVGHSLSVISGSKEASPVLLNTISQHHERFDGSGYPNGLVGDQISPLGGMAGLVDTYTALISARAYAKPISVQQALHQLYASRGQAFKPELVEQFIQCVGVFPVGSLVELNSGEVAVVVSQNRARRLKPRVMLVLDKDRQSYPSPVMLDLILDPATPAGEPYRIMRGLQAGIYEHDPEKTLHALMESPA